MKGARERESEDEERKEKERNRVARFKIQNESQINLLLIKVCFFTIFFNCVKKLKKKLEFTSLF
jgi:hypothetical protein